MIDALQQQLAFFEVIAHSEGTARAPDPYRVCYGYSHTIVSLAQHPYPGEWKGEPLDHLGPNYIGKISTAAGKFQINHPSWVEGATILRLPDFSEQSQMDWTLWRIKGLGALPLVNEGLIPEACRLCAQTWASLPGSLSGQPQRALADVIDFFTQAGGSAA